MKKIIICVLMAVLILCGCQKHEKNETLKNISVSIIANEKNENIKIETYKEYLGDALKENNIIEGKNGQYGIFITSVKGIKADTDSEQWWCLTKDNEAVMTGVDLTPVSDGDKFELTLKTGY